MPGYTCLACGYPLLEERPRGADGGGSYEICPCCSYQYGVTDDDLGISAAEWRKDWRQRGMLWDCGNTVPPSGWNPIAQMHEAGISPT